MRSRSEAHDSMPHADPRTQEVRSDVGRATCPAVRFRRSQAGQVARSTRRNRGIYRISFILLPFLLTGCVEIDVTVEMHDKDPGATVTEQIKVTRKLQQACSSSADREKLLANLGRDAALARMKHMGKGITIVSHETKTLPDGSRQSLAVYRIPDITHLRVSNPFIHSHPPGAPTTIHYGLHTSRDSSNGQIWVKCNADRKHRHAKGMTRRAPTPLERQILRELQPVIADMLSDFRATLRLKVPTRFLGGYVRNLKAGPQTTTLFSVSGKDLDAYGNGFFENEEIMLSILQLDFDAPVLHKHACAFTHNSRTPVLRGKGLYGPWSFRMHPSTYQFERFHKKGAKKK